MKEKAGAETMFSELAGGDGAKDQDLYMQLHTAHEVCEDPQVENYIAMQLEAMKKVEVELTPEWAMRNFRRIVQEFHVEFRENCIYFRYLLYEIMQNSM